MLGNGRLAKDFITTKFAALPSILLRDVMILPELLDNEESKNDQSCSEQLNDESLKLCLNLMTISDIQPIFVKSGATIQYLTQLKQTIEDCELGSDTKLLAGQITQVIRELNENQQV